MNLKKIKQIFSITLITFALTLPLSKLSAMEKTKQDQKINKIDNTAKKAPIPLKKYYHEFKEQHRKRDEQSLNEVIESINKILPTNSNKFHNSNTPEYLNKRGSLKKFKDLYNLYKAKIFNKQVDIINTLENPSKSQNKPEDKDKTIKISDEIKNTVNDLNNLNTLIRQYCTLGTALEENTVCEKEKIIEYKKKLINYINKINNL